MSNDTQTLTLIDFLLARIAEDEQTVADFRYTPRTHRDQLADPSDPMYANLTRALREAEAKRRIVEGLRRAETHVAEVGGRHEALYGLRSAARSLAAVYADHPDYRDEWRS